MNVPAGIRQASALVEEAERAGLALSLVSDEAIRVQGPIDDELRECLCRDKPAVVAELRRRERWGADWLERWDEVWRAEWGRYLATRPKPTDDPRPDLASDSAHWSALLAEAYADPEGRECWGVLHGLRCLGARLEVAANGLRVAPGEIAPDEYASLRKRYLMPIAARVARLLRVASAPDGLPSGDRERM